MNDEEGASPCLYEPVLALDPRRGRGRFARIGVERWPKRTPGHAEHLPITARWATLGAHRRRDGNRLWSSAPRARCVVPK